MNVSLRELTAPRRGAVAVVEIRGEDAARFNQLHTGHPPPRPGAFALRMIRAHSAVIDEALILTRPDGVIEWHLHGGAAILAAVLGLAPQAAPATELAEPAREALIHARTLVAARIAMDQCSGARDRERARLLAMDPAARQQRVELLRRRLHAWKHLVRPTVVLLFGPVNAGKSTLFNALLGSERALVSPQPGTTRDLVREEAQLGPWPILLVDSAGLRAQAGTLEAEGQRLALAERERADWVLWVDPRAEGGRAAPSGATWIRSQCAMDLPHAVRALEDPQQARQRIRELFERERGLSAQPWEPGEFVPLDEDDDLLS